MMGRVSFPCQGRQYIFQLAWQVGGEAILTAQGGCEAFLRTQEKHRLWAS